MKIKSLYISAQEKNAGSLFVSMGVMEILKRNLHRVAFFRPIISKSSVVDRDISFILERYSLDMKYEDSYGCDIEYAETMIAMDRVDELINELIVKFKRLEDKYDFVLCEGIRRSFLSTNINYDLNLKIAQNFSAHYINIINAKESSAHDVYESIMIENKNINCDGCEHFATFVNRLDDQKYEELKEKLSKEQLNIYLLREMKELDMLTIEDVIDGLDAKAVIMRENDHLRIIGAFKVAALGLDNFLGQIQENDLVVVPPDRSEIILALLGALYSKTYPNISGIIFPFNMQAHPNIKKLLDGLVDFNLPILSVSTDTYETAKKISTINSRLRVNNHRKISLSLGLFNSSVDIKAIEQKIATSSSSIMTPMMFEYKLFEMARLNKKRVVLPESSDERVLRAAEIILRREVADIIFLANPVEFKERYMKLGLDLSEANVIDYLKSPLMKQFVDAFYEMRKDKGLSVQAAEDAMIHVNYFATMMVHLGYADGMVSGAMHSTADTIRPALQIIKTTKDTKIVSSLFFMCMKTKVLVYGDCAINQDPNAEELAQIALSCARTASYFGITPKVAMLSYSTGESGAGADVDKVRVATNIVKSLNPNLLIEGPIQYDAAIDRAVAEVKLPNSKVAGDASVFIFPDLNTGNNTYKAVQRSSDVIAIGPILQGLRKPINDLSRGCLVSDIVNTVAITAIQAGEKS